MAVPGGFRQAEHAVTVKYDDGSIDEFTILVPIVMQTIPFILENLPAHIDMGDATEIRTRRLG